ncbi:MAG: hypothetical protein JXQ95_06775 [Alteromonas stellipolaris]|uniref:hypothetical protein n=1 Tax=Alteromonas stellipolaris TaxID=233316 RepID=UPI003B8E73D2
MYRFLICIALVSIVNNSHGKDLSQDPVHYEFCIYLSASIQTSYKYEAQGEPKVAEVMREVAAKATSEKMVNEAIIPFYEKSLDFLPMMYTGKLFVQACRFNQLNPYHAEILAPAIKKTCLDSGTFEQHKYETCLVAISSTYFREL